MKVVICLLRESETVKDTKGKKLKKGTDYTVKYSSGRKNMGTYKGNYIYQIRYKEKKGSKWETVTTK